MSPLGLRAVSPVWEPVPSRSHHHAHLWAETHRQWVSYGDRLNVLRRVPVWDEVPRERSVPLWGRMAYCDPHRSSSGSCPLSWVSFPGLTPYAAISITNLWVSELEGTFKII